MGAKVSRNAVSSGVLLHRLFSAAFHVCSFGANALCALDLAALFAIQCFMLFAAAREVLTFIAGGNVCARCDAACGALTLCSACKTQVSKAMSIDPKERRCPSCGKVMLGGKRVCTKCKNGENILRHVRRALPIASYQAYHRELLTLWKTEGVKALTPFFAERMAETLRSMGERFIVPVPPRKKKLMEKGWDHIADLCKCLKKEFVVLPLLCRTTNIQQKSLSAKERLAVIGSGAYRMKEGKAYVAAMRPAKGMEMSRVCLIDDVMTTGATIESCAALLHAAGVKEVDAVTLFGVD